MPLNLNKFTFDGTQRTAIRKSIFGESVIDMNFNYSYHCIDDATNLRRSSDRRSSVSLFLHNRIDFSIFVDFLNIFEFRKAPQRHQKSIAHFWNTSMTTSYKRWPCLTSEEINYKEKCAYVFFLFKLKQCFYSNIDFFIQI